MHKIWVDISDGRWGMVTDIKVLDVQWWGEFCELFDSADDETRIRMAKAFGESLK